MPRGTVVTISDRTAEARALLRSNDRGGVTIPSPSLYPHVWAWDAAFAAIGWATFDLERATTELESLLAGQWTDGRVPHIQFCDGAPPYFPGPDIWAAGSSTSITNPPMWTIAARRLYERGAEPGRIAALLPALERSHLFFAAARDPLDWGGVAVAHPWESGRDNSPAWDRALAAVDPTRAPDFERVDNTVVKDARQRPSDDEYRRYIVLVRDIADCEFGPGPFPVYDPFLTAVLARAEEDLAFLCSELGAQSDAEARRARAVDCIRDRLWSDEHATYCYFDARAGETILGHEVTALFAATVDDNADHRAAAVADLRGNYWTDAPLSTVAPNSEAFEARRYWRGPTWININWLFLALAELSDDLRRETLELIEKAGFREYYHPLTGEGLGTEHFTWSAALYLDLRASAAEL